MSKVIHANGARTDDPPTLKWNDIMNEVVKLGGAQDGNLLRFPSEPARQQFADWYAQNAACGLYVRTCVTARPAARCACGTHTKAACDFAGACKPPLPAGVYTAKATYRVEDGKVHTDIDFRTAKPVVTDSPQVALGAPRTLKALRMWHWRQVLYFRKLAREAEGHEELFINAPVLHSQADLHLSAVQVLNDVLPGTAEQGCAEEDAQG